MDDRLVLIEKIETETGLLKASFNVNGRKYPIYFRSQLQFTDIVSDVLLLLALPAAMRCGVSLKIDQAISPMLFKQLPAIQDIYQDWEPGLRQVDVIAPLRKPLCEPASADKRQQAISFTGGVDSFYSAIKTPQAALMFVHGLDIPLRKLALRQQVSGKLNEAAAEMHRPLYEMETNIRSFSDHFLKWQLAFGGVLAACALLLSRYIGEFGIPAGQSLEPFQPDGAHPALNYLFSTEYLGVKTVGCETTRINKVKAIAHHPAVQKALRVCWENRGDTYNCGVCEKCLRTMAALEIYSALTTNNTFNLPLNYAKLSRAVALHQSTEMFIEENLAAARENGSDSKLIESLEKSLDPRRVWLFRLLHNKIPRAVYDRCYRLLRSG